MSKRKPRTKIYSPRVWPTWVLLAILWLITRLPLNGITGIGRLMGRLFYNLSPSRRHITQVNLDLCFPELSPQERMVLGRQATIHTALGALETMLPWLAMPRQE